MKHLKKHIFISLLSALFIASFSAHSKTQLTPSHIYNWAKTHNISRLYQFKKYINLYDKNNNTALCIAQQQHDKVSYSLLLKYGASTDVPCHIPLEDFKEPPQPKEFNYQQTALIALGAGAATIAAFAGGGGGGSSGESTPQCPHGYSTLYADISSCGTSGSQGWLFETNGSVDGKPCGKCTPLTCKDNSSIEYSSKDACPTFDAIKATSVTTYGFSGDLNCYTCNYQCNIENNSYPSPQDCKADFNGNDCTTTTTTDTNIGKAETIQCYSPDSCNTSIYDTPNKCHDNYISKSSCKDASLTIHHQCICNTSLGYYSDINACLNDTNKNNKGFFCDDESSGCIIRGNKRDCAQYATTSNAETYTGLVYVNSEPEGYSGEDQCFSYIYKCDEANDYFTNSITCERFYTSCSPITITTNENVTYTCYISNTCDTSKWTKPHKDAPENKCPTGTEKKNTCTDTTGTYIDCPCNESTYFSDPNACTNHYIETGYGCITSGYCYTQGNALECNKNNNSATKVESCGNGSNPSAWTLSNTIDGYSGGEACYLCSPASCATGYVSITGSSNITITQTPNGNYSGYTQCADYTAQCNTENNYFATPQACLSAFPGNEECSQVSTQNISLLNTTDGSSYTTTTIDCYTPHATCDTTGWTNPTAGNTCGEGHIPNGDNYCKSLNDEFIDCICNTSLGYYSDINACLNDTNKNNKGFLCNGESSGCIIRGNKKDCAQYATTSNAETYTGLVYVNSEPKGYSGEDQCFSYTYKCDEANNYFTNSGDCESKFTSCSPTTITTNENVTYTCYISNTCDTSTWSNPQNAPENKCPTGTEKKNTCTDTTGTYIDCPCNESTYFSDPNACTNHYIETGYGCITSGYCYTQGNALECNKGNNSATKVENCGDGSNPSAWILSNTIDGYSGGEACYLCSPASCATGYVSITGSSNITITQTPNGNYSGYTQCADYTAQCNTENNYFATPQACLYAFPGNEECSQVSTQNISLLNTTDGSSYTTATIDCYTPNTTCDITGWTNPIAGNTCGEGYIKNGDNYCKSLNDEFIDCICNASLGYYSDINACLNDTNKNNKGFLCDGESSGCIIRGNKKDCAQYATTSNAETYTGLVYVGSEPKGYSGEDQCFSYTYKCDEANNYFTNSITCERIYTSCSPTTITTNENVSYTCFISNTCDSTIYPYKDNCPTQMEKDEETGTCKDQTGSYINCLCNNYTVFTLKEYCEEKTGYVCKKDETYGCHYPTSEIITCNEGYATESIDCGSSNLKGTEQNTGWDLTTENGQISGGKKCKKCKPIDCSGDFSTTYQSIENCTSNRKDGWGTGWNFSSSGRSGDNVCGKCEEKSSCDIGYTECNTYSNLVLSKEENKFYQGDNACYTCNYTCDESTYHFDSPENCQKVFGDNSCSNTSNTTTTTPPQTKTCYKPSTFCNASYGERQFYSVCPAYTYMGRFCKTPSEVSGDYYTKECLCDTSQGYYSSTNTFPGWYATYHETSKCYTQSDSKKDCPTGFAVENDNSTCTTATNKNGWDIDTTQTSSHYSGEKLCHPCIAKSCQGSTKPFPNGTATSQCGILSSSPTPWYVVVNTTAFSNENYSGDTPCGDCNYQCNSDLSSYNSSCMYDCVTLSYTNSYFNDNLSCTFKANFCVNSTDFYTKEECEKANPEYYCKLSDLRYNGSDFEYYCYVIDTSNPKKCTDTCPSGLIYKEGVTQSSQNDCPQIKGLKVTSWSQHEKDTACGYACFYCHYECLYTDITTCERTENTFCTTESITTEFGQSVGYCLVPVHPSTQSSSQTFIGKKGKPGETIVNPRDETISMQTFGDNTFVGMYTKTGGTAINEGKIEITGNTGTAIGILGDGQNTIENKGIINVSGENAYGIKVIDGTDTSITNSGEINVSASSDAYGIYIEENGNLATVTNTGTISINGNLNDENNAIVLNGAELRNQNQFYVEGDLNIKSLQARAFVVERGSQITAQSVEGELTAGISTVQSDENKDQYVEENSVIANDTSNLEVKSESALFKASTQINSKGNTNIVLDRKDFKEFTPNSSMGEYLNQNYQDGNFVDTFNSMKEATSAFDIASKSVKFMGADNMLNFVDENIQVLRGLNRNIAETILTPDKDEPYRVLSGAHNYSLETDDKGLLSGYDINSNSVYMFGDKRLNNWSRLGLGLSFTDINSSYEHGGSRDLSYVNIFVPYLYKLGPKLHLASILSFGYGYGDFERDAIHTSKISQFTYGLTNELRYKIDLNGFAELEPALMLNALGYQEKGINEGKDDTAIITKNNHALSVEAGLGLFIKKEVKTSENSKLGFKIGGIYYHEFASPYNDITARHRASNYWYKINDYANLYKRDRAVFESVIDYMYKDISIYLKYNKLIQNNNPELLDLGIKYNF